MLMIVDGVDKYFKCCVVKNIFFWMDFKVNVYVIIFISIQDWCLVMVKFCKSFFDKSGWVLWSGVEVWECKVFCEVD